MIHRWDIATPMNHRCCWLRASATSSAPRCSSPPLPDGMIATLLDEVAAGDLRVVVDRDFPLAEAAKAHAYIETRQMFGRVELIPRSASRHCVRRTGATVRRTVERRRVVDA